ncbi:hypothetical protein [Vulgatibacter incomptus]|uniref:TPR domain protein n=1 Tax=Vulgatibacter incomptus TaxID=1391653 RepID=A0A0K1PHF5_9BACT|nr:hypothetical protein [Vulgatibacter incomptus]AKU92942.1 TPR domain protein [Vulgatibacter incomptus]
MYSKTIVPIGRRAWLPLALVLALGAGCATYSDRTLAARNSLLKGDLHGGEAKLNGLLGVDSSRDLPSKWGSETALTLLERATVLQAQGHYRVSARDFSAAEKELELLDIARDDVGSIGKYVYSDDATKYKTTPTEKLLLNAFNMVNYLAQGDLAGARVEARRFEVMRKYLRDYAPDESHGAFGAYLAGLIAERSGDAEEALRYYDEVLAESQAPSLSEPIRRLARLSSYRTPRISAVLDEAESGQPAQPLPAEIVVIVKTGQSPVKEARRIPVGAALGLAANYVSGDTKVLEYGMFKVVSYPDLMPAKSVFTSASVRLGESAVALDPITNVSAEISREYEALKPKIVGAALTRMIVRAAAAEAARYAGRQQSSGLGFLAAALVEGTMVALDKPDTRSWSTLPARVQLTRIAVEPGTHEVELEVRGMGVPVRVYRTVEVAQGGLAVIDLTTLR